MNDPYQPPHAGVAESGPRPFSIPMFLLGFFLPFVTALVTVVLFMVLIGVAYGNQSSSDLTEYLMMGALFAPLAVLLALEIFFLVKRMRELAIGVAIGFGLIVLLVTACFGVIWMGY